MPSEFRESERFIDPSTNIDAIPAIIDLKRKEQTFQQQTEEKRLIEKDFKKQQGEKKWYHAWLTQGILALASAGVTAVLLFIINPPLTQQKRTDEFTTESQDWKKVLGLCLLVFLLVLLLPEFIRLIQVLIYKSKAAKKQMDAN